MRATLPTLLVSAASLLGVQAQLTQSNGLPRTRFSVNARFGLSMEVQFTGVGHTPRAANPGPLTGHGLDRNYDDGYVRKDVGIPDQLTWNWGYENRSQLTGQDTLQMHSISAPGTTVKAEDSYQAGFEVVMSRELFRRRNLSVGVQLGLGHSDLSFRRAGVLRSGGTLLTDTYGLGGILVPEAPFSGNTGGPGPLIDDVPGGRELETVRNAAVTRGSWSLEGNLYGFRLGPYGEVPLGSRVNLFISGGLSVAVVDAAFRWREVTVLPGRSAAYSRGEHRQTSALFGAYVESGLNFTLTERWSAQAGAQFHFLGESTDQAQSRSTRLNSRSALFLYSGLSYSF